MIFWIYVTIALIFTLISMQTIFKSSEEKLKDALGYLPTTGESILASCVFGVIWPGVVVLWIWKVLSNE